MNVICKLEISMLLNCKRMLFDQIICVPFLCGSNLLQKVLSCRLVHPRRPCRPGHPCHPDWPGHPCQGFLANRQSRWLLLLLCGRWPFQIDEADDPALCKQPPHHHHRHCEGCRVILLHPPHHSPLLPPQVMLVGGGGGHLWKPNCMSEFNLCACVCV